MNRRGFLTAAAGALAGGSLLACGFGDDEDCDEEDRREGDTDCDDDGLKVRKPKTKTGGGSKPRTRTGGGFRRGEAEVTGMNGK